MRPILVSNIAWPVAPDERFLDTLAAEEAQGVELAASLLWPEPVDATSGERCEWRSKVEGRGLTIGGLHSLLFARPDLQILADGAGRMEALDYLRRTVDLCADLGGRSLVLGSPANRRIHGLFDAAVAKQRAASILHDAGEYADSAGCFFALEALPPPRCDFLMTLGECDEIVRLADSPGVRLHFDSGSADVMDRDASDETLEGFLQMAAHCHVNDFEALPPGSTAVASHSRYARLLDAVGYEGAVSIEMRPSADFVRAVREAIRFVRSVYAGAGAVKEGCR